MNGDPLNKFNIFRETTPLHKNKNEITQSIDKAIKYQKLFFINSLFEVKQIPLPLRLQMKESSLIYLGNIARRLFLVLFFESREKIKSIHLKFNQLNMFISWGEVFKIEKLFFFT